MAYVIRKFSFFTKQLTIFDHDSRKLINETISEMRESSAARDIVKKTSPQFELILSGTGVEAKYVGSKLLEFEINSRWRIFGYQTDGFDKTIRQPAPKKGKYKRGPEQKVHYDGQLFLIRIGHLEDGSLINPGSSLKF
jgi:hypothetical protein